MHYRSSNNGHARKEGKPWLLRAKGPEILYLNYYETFKRTFEQIRLGLH